VTAPIPRAERERVLADLHRALGTRPTLDRSRVGRHNIVRSTPIAAAGVRVGTSTAPGGIGTLFGYAAVFGTETVIADGGGDFRERIAQGAFADSIGAAWPVLLLEHGQDPSVGNKPLGKLTSIREDTRGLAVEAVVADTSYGRDLVELLRLGAYAGMSFRFSVRRDRWESPATKGGMPLRVLEQVELYELGPVAFPAYPTTSVGVRDVRAPSLLRPGRRIPARVARDQLASLRIAAARR